VRFDTFHQSLIETSLLKLPGHRRKGTNAGQYNSFSAANLRRILAEYRAAAEAPEGSQNRSQIGGAGANDNNFEATHSSTPLVEGTLPPVTAVAC
jgi:hypothetical protein